MLFFSGATRSIGNVDDGTTHTDFMEEERQRGITIQAAATTFSWKDFMFSLIDTPGHVDFSMEVIRSVRVLDGVVAVIDGVKGVEAQTIGMWKHITHHSVPAIGFVNKMDREGASIPRAKEMMARDLRVVPVPLQLSLGSGRDFGRVVDLVELAELAWGEGGDYTRTALAESTADANTWASIMEARATMLDEIAMVDDAFMEVRSLFEQLTQVLLADGDGGRSIPAVEIHSAVSISLSIHFLLAD
jgi:elongation factor G